MNAFVTHPSVRIKGTENNYDPVQCLDATCINRNPHMHCPFCTRQECFQDPVILRAHYRVKHVDKGIEFAGLTILRCCDHCDIVGTIKGLKEFKGAHWHCYKCKNGFNRRDEAVKHYRTHFRNPQTTFQIQISQLPIQEVMRQYMLDVQAQCADSEQEDDGLTGSENLVFPIQQSIADHTPVTLHNTSGLTGTPITYSRISCKSDDVMQVSVAANEVVGSEGQTIMIIEDGGRMEFDETSLPMNNAAFTGLAANTAHTLQLLPASEDLLMDQRSQLEQQLIALSHANEEISQQKEDMEKELREEILQLKNELTECRAALEESEQRVEAMSSQHSSGASTDDSLELMMEQLKREHSDLLNQQLTTLRKQAMPKQLSSLKVESPLVYSVVDNLPDLSAAGMTSVQSVTLSSITPGISHSHQQPQQISLSGDGDQTVTITDSSGQILTLSTMAEASQHLINQQQVDQYNADGGGDAGLHITPHTDSALQSQAQSIESVESNTSSHLQLTCTSEQSRVTLVHPADFELSGEDLATDDDNEECSPSAKRLKTAENDDMTLQLMN